MFSSAIRLAASRVAPRAAARCTTAFVARPNPTVFTLRHFSSPPTFLNASDVTDRVMDIVKKFDQVDPAKVSPETKFTADLGLDSLDVVEVVMAIEEEFAIEIPDTEADAMASIADAVEYISKHPMAR